MSTENIQVFELLFNNGIRAIVRITTRIEFHFPYQNALAGIPIEGYYFFLCGFKLVRKLLFKKTLSRRILTMRT